MRLIDAYNILVEDGVSDNPRYFAEVYKGFQFKDDDTLADYIDFIVHEPIHWMRGFPAKLISKTSFSKPKTAVIKLLKKPAVQTDLGADVAEAAHGVIWSTFKKEHETLLKERERLGGAPTVVERLGRRDSEGEPADSTAADIPTLNEIGSGELEEDDVGSYESLNEPIPELRPYITAKVSPWPEVLARADARPLPSISIAESTPHHTAPTKVDTDAAHRIATLKEALFHMSETLPPSAAAAFRILVEAI